MNNNPVIKNLINHTLSCIEADMRHMQMNNGHAPTATVVFKSGLEKQGDEIAEGYRDKYWVNEILVDGVCYFNDTCAIRKGEELQIIEGMMLTRTLYNVFSSAIACGSTFFAKKQSANGQEEIY